MHDWRALGDTCMAQRSNFQNTLSNRQSNLEYSPSVTMILCCSQQSSPTSPQQPQPPASLGVLGISASWHHIIQVLSAMPQGSARSRCTAVPQFLVASNGPVSISVPLLRGHFSCSCCHRRILSTVGSMCKPVFLASSMFPEACPWEWDGASCQ